MNFVLIGFITAFFIFLYITINSVYNDGYKKGLSDMKEAILKDMKEYPTKWKWHIDREQNEK